MAYGSSYYPESTTINKSLAKTFGYMGIGLLITGAVSFLVAYLFASFIGQGNDAMTTAAITTYAVILIVSFIVMIVDSFLMSAVLAKGTRSIWPHYIIYAVVMGVFVSGFLIMGVSFATMGEAFVISAVAFFTMFAIGYFSKTDLNWLGMIASGLLTMLILFGLFWGIFFLINPAGFVVYNLILSVAIGVFVLIVAAVDAYNIKKIMERGSANKNICLYCAFIMYSDFIQIFIRILYLLLLLNGKRR